MFNRLDHVGIVVSDIDATLKTYCEQLGFTLLERTEIPEQKVVAAFLDGGNSTIELISPTDTESGTAKYLANRGEGTHHIAYEVDDIVAALAELKAQGVRLIDETPRQGVHGLVAFVHEVGASEDSRIIIDAIISLAASLRLETVAEGVETNAQLDYLMSRGCRVAQGFLFGMPMAPEQIQPLLAELRDDPDMGPTVIMPPATALAR